MKEISLPLASISITSDEQSTSITSDLHQKGEPDSAACNIIAKTIESIVLAHFKEGLDINNPQYINGLRIVAEQINYITSKSDKMISLEEPSEFAIALESWVSNPDKPGYLSYKGPKSAEEIEIQIKKALEQITIHEGEDTYNAYDAAEWVSMTGKYGSPAVHIPMHAQPISFYTEGNNEGYFINIYAKGDNETFNPICTIKYLLDRGAVSKINERLMDAFDKGSYGER